MKVCILGGGGRERALAWTADKVGPEVYVVPGNAGIFIVSRTPHGR